MQPQLPDTNLLTHSITTNNPIEFVLIEDFLWRQTESRVPAWRPKTIVRRGGWDEYQRGQKMKTEVKQLIDDMWLDLCRRLLQLRNDTIMYQAGTALRQMEWADQLRQRRDQDRQTLSTHQRTLEIEDRVAAIRDGRLHGQTRELEVLRQVFEKELMALKYEADDPAYRAQRYLAAVALFTPILEEIADGPHTTAVKNQMSSSILDAVRLLQP